jgi:hypothetical protein
MHHSKSPMTGKGMNRIFLSLYVTFSEQIHHTDAGPFLLLPDLSLLIRNISMANSSYQSHVSTHWDLFKNIASLKFEVLMVVKMSIVVFWVVMPCSFPKMEAIHFSETLVTTYKTTVSQPTYPLYFGLYFQ